jgi:predicted metal-binding membrane protein
MSGKSGLEILLRSERTIIALGLGLLCVLAWAYLLTGAGMHEAMPGMGGMPAASMESQPQPMMRWVLMLGMWWVMMIAMMTPAAAPVMLLYARVARSAAVGGAIPTIAFAMGYLSVWLGFSLLAVLLQWGLERNGLLSAMMRSQSGWLSGGILVAAGLYQLSPLKHVCLANCRGPAAFLSRHWRPGNAGAFRLGLIHGGYCVGCCWLLMALLFVGGVMNPVWIALLAILVALEKLAPHGVWIGRGVGVGLIAWGVVTFAI